MKPRAYATADAFKAALDQRLRNVAEPGVGITRRRQLLVFDRYLARLDRVLGDNATLKGGLVLEVRLERARTTRDIDLRVSGSADGLLHRLQEAGRIDLGDFMTFEVRTDVRHPDPPPDWEEPYAAMAAEDDLPWPTLSSVTAAARAFIDPVLAGRKDDRWSPATWTWRPAR